ncbi:MAG TPA: TonB-dependent receptor plug domain-containing protein, partial [Gemmatimonadaceae bacterium]
MSRLQSFCLVATFLLAAAARGALAQAGSLFRATVADTLGHMLPSAELTISGIAEVARSDSLGRVALGRIPAGYRTVAVRRLGYAPLSARFLFSGGDTLEADFQLEEQAEPLAPVAITSTRDTYGLNSGFLRRRSMSAGGTFLTRKDFEKDDTQLLGDVLVARIPNANIVIDPRSGRRSLASKRGASLGKGSTVCYSQIILDGIRIFAPPGDTRQPPDIDSFLPEHVAAIEYYPGPATTPPEFGGTGASCAT